MEAGIKSFKGKLVIKAVLRLESGMHIGGSSDFAPIGAVDSPFVRDTVTKQPIIPGSSLKGKIRTLLARSLHDGYGLNKVDEDKDCVKRLFGCSAKNEFHASRLIFTDSKLAENSLRRLANMDTDTYIGEVKWENSINRVTAVANPRQIERVPAGAEFDVSIIYNVEKLDELEEDMEILADGMQLLQYDYIGGHGSRGYGRVSFNNFRIEKVAVNNSSSINVDDICEIFQTLEG